MQLGLQRPIKIGDKIIVQTKCKECRRHWNDFYSMPVIVKKIIMFNGTTNYIVEKIGFQQTATVDIINFDIELISKDIGGVSSDT